MKTVHSVNRKHGGASVSIVGSIWVVCLRNGSILGKERDSVVGPASIAAVVIVVTIDQFLLAQTDQVTSGVEVDSLDRSGGGECPTATTLALVLHTSHVSRINPIHCRGNTARFSVQGLSPDVRLLSSSESESLGRKLLDGHVCELVHSLPVSVQSQFIANVVLGNLFDCLSPSVESGDLLCDGFVLLVVLVLPRLPQLRVGGGQDLVGDGTQAKLNRHHSNTQNSNHKFHY